MILTPKRKLPPMSEGLIEHTKETIINEIQTTSRSFVVIGTFDQWIKIPVGTDKYPNPP